MVVDEHVELTKQHADDIFPASANYVMTKPATLK